METDQESHGTVVIVEDSVHARNIIAYLLKKNNFEVLEFRNGVEALESFKKTPIDNLKLVFSDIMMPEMNGLELIENMRTMSQFDEVPIVIISAAVDREFVEKAKSLKITSYLLKPLNASKIIACLQKLFPSNQFVDLEIKA